MADRQRGHGSPWRGRGRGRGRGTYHQSSNHQPQPFNNKYSSGNRDRHHKMSTSYDSHQSKTQGVHQPIRRDNHQSSTTKDASANQSALLKQAEDKIRKKQAEFNRNADAIINEMANNKELSSSSEDEQLDDTSIIDKLFLSYNGNRQEIDKILNLIQNCCHSGSITCLICIGGIRHHDAIWTCQSCQCIFHLACIAKWSKEGSVNIKPQLSAILFPQQETKWLCPNCRGEYTSKDYPTKYYCYCGKSVDPKFNPWLVPHSCGDLCERLLKPECGHRCQLLCHPGPCPPCPQMVKSTCYCGQGGSTIRRCGRREWSCGQICNKLLTCKKHRCENPCHPGECPKCEIVTERPCRCGKEVSARPCDEDDWQCDKPCNKILPCGFHRCERICHDKACGNCPRSGERSCPCGKSKFILPCTDDVPVCGDTCGKILGCGKHKCTERCHYGDCSKCRQMVTKMCRCGKHQKSLQCHLDFTCESRCQILRDCGRHQCNKRCCTGNCPPCEQICGRTLGCGSHKCKTRCHSGRCYPCPLMVEVKCFCQVSSISVPCGREKYLDPPKCKELCRIPPRCHHEKRDEHRCHYGECPPCRQICNLPLPNCEHYCPEKCHIAVAVVEKLTALQITRLKKGEKPAISYKSRDCPPCVVPIDQKCFGEHEIQTFPCHQLRPYSCGRRCGRRLHCTNHTCSLECHVVTNAVDEYSSGSECLQCEESCHKARPAGCEHECPLPCHPGECQVCKLLVKRWCFCRLVLLHIECNELTSANEEKMLSLLTCKGQCPKMLQCGHRCPKDCHPGECPGREICNRKRTARCACKRLKKTIVCSSVSLDYIVDCDKECEKIKLEKRKVKEEEILEREQQLKKLEQEKLDVSQREPGRKRKRRKNKDVMEDDLTASWSSRHPVLLNLIRCSIVICILAAFVAFIMKS